MRAIQLILIVMIPALSHADDAKPFNLQARGDKVCKVGRYFPEPVCYASASATDTRFPIPREIDLRQKVQNYMELVILKDQANQIDNDKELIEVGAILFMRDEDIKMVYFDYRALTINNVGVDLEHAVTKQNETIVPFVASVDWQGTLGFSGTLHVEGTLKFPTANVNIDEQDNFEKLNTFFAQQLDVRHFNDSSVATWSEGTRFLQTIGRHLQLTRVYGLSGDREAQTRHLLQDVIGPALVGEYIYLPLFRSHLQTLKHYGLRAP